MKKKQVIGFFLAVSVFLSSVCTGSAVGNASASEETGTANSEWNLEGFEELETNVVQLEETEASESLLLDGEVVTAETEQIGEEEMVPVIITFEEAAIIENDPEAVMNFWNEWKSSLLQEKQDRLLQKIEKKFLDGEELEVHYQYTWLLNGIATEVPYGMIPEIEEIEGVKEVIIQTEYSVCTSETKGMSVEGSQSSYEILQAEGYDGKGIKIAVIDTGIDTDHQSFQALKASDLTDNSATQDSVKAVLEELNSYQRCMNYYGERLIAEDVYRSTKIAYGFNYADTLTSVDHVAPNTDDHGTHVAGIAAANALENGEMAGVAPAAQLYVMKVFGNNGGTASTENILAALEDALILDADVINMSLGTPSGFSSGGEYMDEIYEKVSETGTVLVVAAGNNGNSGDGTNWMTGKSLTDNPDNATINSPGTYVNATTVANADCTGEATEMYFSTSWGPSPDLRLEPDITAPGANIYSAKNNGTYGFMSGTSMASPCIAGMAALLVQQLEETISDVKGEDRYSLINTLLMSTAEPIAYEDAYFSPRVQGTGLVNVEKALKADTYLSVSGMDVPKVELFDDPDKTGSYQYAFQVNNVGEGNAYYELETCVQTENPVEMNGLQFMSGKPIELDAEVTMESDGLMKTLDYNSDGKMNTSDARYAYLESEENKQGEMAFRYDLNEDHKADNADVQKYLDTLVGKSELDWEESFLEVKAGEAEEVSVSIEVTEVGKAYMDANYKNGIYVEGYTCLYGQNKNSVDLSLPYMGFYGDWTSAPAFDEGYYWEDLEASGANYVLNEVYTDKNYYERWKLGVNPYVKEVFQEKYITLSPNDDGFADSVNEIRLSLLRNIKNLTVSFENEDGEVYYEDNRSDIRKASFNSYYNQYFYYGGTDSNYELLTNGEKVIMKVALELDYKQSEPEIWEIPITIDLEAPVVGLVEEKEDITVLTNDTQQVIRMKFADNVGTAAVCLLDEAGRTFAKYVPDHEAEENDEYQYFDITGIGNKFTVTLCDYGCNEVSYAVETSGNDYVYGDKVLYGYRVDDELASYAECCGWLDINTENAVIKNIDPNTSQYLTAAEYVDGYVIGRDVYGSLAAFEFGKWEERQIITEWIEEVTDMAYDPVTKKLYAYIDNGEMSRLVTIDPVYGTVTTISTGYVEKIIAMTCDAEGTLYAMTGSGELKTVNKELGRLNENILAETGIYPRYSQSMTYDMVNDYIYWASYEYDWTNESGESQLIKIDVKDEYAITELGAIGGNAKIVGLMFLNDKGTGLFDNFEVEAAAIEPAETLLLAGNTATLELKVEPWCAEMTDVVWKSTDSAVAAVSADGVVTAAATGKTEVSVEYKGTEVATCTITVIEANTDLYGFVSSGEEEFLNHWAKFNTVQLQPETLFDVVDESGVQVVFEAAEYVKNAEEQSGTIYAYNNNGMFYTLNAETGSIIKKNTLPEYIQMTDMAYDYKTNCMYGLTQPDYFVNLVKIDMTTGESTVLCENIKDAQGAPVYSISIDSDGIMYFLTAAKNICKYDLASGVVETVGSLGTDFPADMMTTGMTYDYENDGLYITVNSYRRGLLVWYYSLEHKTGIKLNRPDGMLQIIGLYTIPESAEVVE